MLSGGDNEGVPDGIGMARLAWTRLPTADAEGAGPSTSAAAADDELFSAAAVESLDYEVIENYAYREEQVRAPHPAAVRACGSGVPSVAQLFLLLGGCAGAAEQVLGALLRHAQVAVLAADRRR
jgi:hypothetical protein